MIIDFNDDCWDRTDQEWQCNLGALLVLIMMREQHAVLADPTAMLKWLEVHLPPFVTYFNSRLRSAQPRSGAVRLEISPAGASEFTSPPPWKVTASAAHALVEEPLRLVLENDDSDQLFVKSTVPKFADWCARRYVQVEMGGGSTMENKIVRAANDTIGRWRTFFLFDSDRLHPTELIPGWLPPAEDDCQGHKFEAKCAGMPRQRWHGLKRRSIENYLPQSVLSDANAQTTAALFNEGLSEMRNFYNFKKGLRGDGLHPDKPNPARAARSQGFWASLTPELQSALNTGYGTKIAERFNAVPENHVWSADVIAESEAFASALQDAM